MVGTITGSAPRALRVRVAPAARAILLVLGAALALVIVQAPWTKIICSRRDQAVLDLRTIRDALSLHHSGGRLLPDSATGLQALVESKNLERLPIDPWNHPYGYARNGGLVQVASYGADGVPGGQGEDADLIETFSASEVTHFWDDLFRRGAN